MTNQEYSKLVDSRSAPSPMGKNLVWAFLTGGLICTAGQGLLSLYQSWGLDKETAGTAVSITLILAAALAFVVLYTLSTTNISERAREVATIKVLGFYDLEVHSYMNKETIILSIMGIVLGMPLGMLISEGLGWVLKIPGLYFDISIHRVSYLICGVIAFVFTIIVNQITNRLLNSIDPAEALKSVE